jgi:hypothetical protein
VFTDLLWAMARGLSPVGCRFYGHREEGHCP